MGITLEAIERMEKLGLFKAGRMSILDIGSSNLYSANAAGIERFLGEHAEAPIADVKAFAERLAKGSGYDPVKGGLNESFAGELFEKAGMEYLAFDIADGYRTRILDLNHAVLPKELRGRFNLVLNFGTTEHILNQYNSFKVIHDATRVGGYIHHSLPGVGYADHGYITYTARCFFDIAGYNEYEVIDFWFDGPSGRNEILLGLRNYSRYFPALKRVLEGYEQSVQGKALRGVELPDVGLNIVLRKVKERPFWGALESSTSVGAIPGSVTANYTEYAKPTAALPPKQEAHSIARRISRTLASYPAAHGFATRAYTMFFAGPSPTAPGDTGGRSNTAGELIDSSERESLAWERAWQRFSHTSLVGRADAESASRVRAEAFADACTLLSSPAFSKASVDRRAATIFALHDTFMSAPSQELVLVADLGLRQFRQMLSVPGLTVPQALGVFDALHSMYFSGVSDVLDLRRFDAIVAPFEEWLIRQNVSAGKRIAPGPKNGTLTVAYLLHTAHFDRGNAVSPLIVFLASIHSRVQNRRVLLYLVQHVGPDFMAKIVDSGVSVRDFPQGRSYERLDDIEAALREDKVDVVITEQNRAVATALFSRRVAPVQIWVDTGFPFWNLGSLDWTLSPVMTGPPNAMLRKSGIHCHLPLVSAESGSNTSEIERIRGMFPPDSFILGVFVRLIKLSAPVFDLLDALLKVDPAFQLLIAGTGNPSEMREFVARSGHAGRIRFLNENVDLRIYGRAVDIMCDTFPFIGGHACREVGVQGTPVVSMLGTPWDAVLREERSPELLARDQQDYVSICRRLFNDGDFRGKQQVATQAIFARRADPDRTIADIEAAISMAVALPDRGSRQ